MIVSFLSDMGPWSWVLAGFVFLSIEILAPGFLFLWLGLAALAVGGVGLLGGSAIVWWWSVPAQFVAFAILSLIAAVIGRRIYDPRHTPSDEPLLNQRGAQLIGRKVVLTEPIDNGVGRVKIGDTVWRVTGPDTASGADMVVVRAEEGRLVLSHPAA